MTETVNNNPFFLIAESSPDAILVVSDGLYQYLNQAAIRLFAADSSSQLIGTPVMERIHPDHREIVAQRIQHLFQNDKSAPLLEERYLRLDGSEVDVEVTASPFWFNDRKSSLVFVRDISERKKAERALKASEERFRLMFERNDAMMLLINAENGEIVDANRSASAFYGYPIDQLRGMPITHINLLSAGEVAQQRLRATKQLQNFFIFPHRLSNGERRTVEVHSTPIETGDCKLLLSIIHDITERERAVSELRQNKNLLQSVIDNTTSVIFIKDLAGRYILVNNSYTDLVQQPSAMIIGKTDFDIFNEEVATRLQAADRQAIASATPQELEEIIQLNDGTHIFFTVKYPLIDQTGTTYAVCGIATDITERIKAAEEIQLLNCTLEQRVHERTRELNEKRSELHQALSLNESILQSTGVGIAVYRHDGQCILCNPGLADITGGTQEELLLQNFRSIVSWQNSGIARLAERVLDSGVREDSEIRLVSSFGRSLWLNVQLSRIDNQDAPHLLLVAHDITRQKEIAESLAKQEREIWTLANNVPDNILRADCDGRLLFCNTSMLVSLGKSASDVIGRTLSENFPDGRYADLTLALARVARSGRSEDFEQLFMRNDDKRFYAIRIVAERDDDSRTVSVLAVGRDLTDLRNAEEELRLAASVFHNSAEGVMITDADNSILSVNPAFAEITGYSAQEAVGSTTRLLRSERHPPDFYRAMWQQLNDEGIWQGEIWNRRKGGEAYLEWLTINRIDDSNGVPVHYVAVFHDITELRRMDEHIHHLAFHDALTGLPNRTLLQDRLHHALERAKREKSKLSVTFIDLDRFKAINDSLGHDVGDLLLQEVARRINDRVRTTDTVARMGGDEFVVVMEDLHESGDCANLAQVIIDEISKPMVLNDHQVTICASMGMAFYPEDGSGELELMKRADIAMYEAKEAGRNTYRFFQPAMLNRVSNRLHLEMELRNAVRHGELELHYQPKVQLPGGKPDSTEALVRWHHSKHGLIPPMEFIPLAEECGLINELGDWVLSNVCRQIAEWAQHGREVKVAVNLSAYQLESDSLVDRIHELTRQYRISPSSLELEITESAIMCNPERVSHLLSRLRGLGITIAVDDFGTGYSSLAYLRKLPIDVLKIDRSFVMEADSNDEDAQIIKTILTLGASLKLTVVAEGIETASQAELVTTFGCELAQGYYFSRPLPVVEFEQWWDKTHHGQNHRSEE